MRAELIASNDAERLPRSVRRGIRLPRGVGSYGPLLVLLALIALVGAVQRSFLSIPSFEALAQDAAIFVLLAAGQTLVIMIGGIDLSVAALTSFLTVLLALWIPRAGVGMLLVVLVLGAVFGAVQGFIHAKTQVPSFIVTLGAMGLWDSAGLMASNASTVPLTTSPALLNWLEGDTGGMPNNFLLGVAVCVAAWAALRWLPIGRQIRAVGNSERAAAILGVNRTVVRVAVFAASGLSAGLAALALAAQQQSGGPTMADALLLPSIAAVVIGGTAITGGSGGLIRTVVGALIISVLRVGMGVMNINPLYQQIAYGLLVICAIVLTVDRSKLGIVK